MTESTDTIDDLALYFIRYLNDYISMYLHKLTEDRDGDTASKSKFSIVKIIKLSCKTYSRECNS